MNQSLLKMKLKRLRAVDGPAGITVDAFREGWGLVKQLSVPIAYGNGHETFILDRTQKKGIDFFPLLILKKFGERFLKSAGYETRTDIDVADEPLQGKMVYKRHHRIGKQRHRPCEGNNEPEGQAQRS
jgi:hypothetical protein